MDDLVSANPQLLTGSRRAGCEAPASYRQQNLTGGRPQVAPTANRMRCDCAALRQSIHLVLRGRFVKRPYDVCFGAQVISPHPPRTRGPPSPEGEGFGQKILLSKNKSEAAKQLRF